MTIKSALLSLQSLLSTPEPKDPQDAEVARMLLDHPDQFQRTAREWALVYATAPKVTNWSKTAPQMVTPPKHKAAKSMEEDRKLQAAR